MIEYHLSKNGKIVGVFNYHEVMCGLTDGTFTASDYFWKAGMAEWRVLGEFQSLEATLHNHALHSASGGAFFSLKNLKATLGSLLKIIRSIFDFITESIGWLMTNIIGPVVAFFIKYIGWVFVGLILSLLSGKGGRRRGSRTYVSRDNGD